MSVEAYNIVNEVLSDFGTWWATSGNTAVAWPNRHFKPVANASFVRPNVSINASRMLEIGRASCAADQIDGLFTVDLFVKSSSGVKAAYTLAQLIITKYTRRQDMAYLYFDTPFIAYETDDQNTGMYQINIVVPFHAEA